MSSHTLDRIDVSAYDLSADPHTTVGRKTAARSICVVLHYPPLRNEYIAHAVVCRYHLKPNTNLTKLSTIRGVLTRVGNDINSAYQK